MKKHFLTLLLCCGLYHALLAQKAVLPAATDLASIEAITAAGLKIISGPKGQQRDMEAFKALFLPGAQMGGVFYKGDSSFVRLTTAEKFAERNGQAYAELGFYENQLALRVERFGNLATAFQTYETRTGSPAGKVEDRGVNTYQLVYDYGRWWIASLLYTPETKKTLLPEKYLK